MSRSKSAVMERQSWFGARTRTDRQAAWRDLGALREGSRRLRQDIIVTQLRMVALQGRIQALGESDAARDVTHDANGTQRDCPEPDLCPHLQSMAEDFRRIVLARCARCQGARGGCLLEAMDRFQRGDDR